MGTLLLALLLFLAAVRSGALIVRGDSAAVLHAIGTLTTRRQSGRYGITLVGAGPGSPDLLTVAAAAALASAEVVICDQILSDEMMAIAPHASFRVAEKLPGFADAGQDELNAWGLDALHSGKRVVRLKSGDPFLFGRGGEEVAFYETHGFACSVIPGVTSALAAPLVAGIPVTHRGAATSVLIATGQGRGGELPPLPPADSARTLVLLMAVARLRSLDRDLAAVGYGGDTPVAIVERATHADERVTVATLATVAAAAASVGVRSPAVIVVGAVVHALSDARAAATAAVKLGGGTHDA